VLRDSDDRLSSDVLLCYAADDNQRKLRMHWGLPELVRFAIESMRIPPAKELVESLSDKAVKERFNDSASTAAARALRIENFRARNNRIIGGVQG
jgi:hypothetical protein